MLRRTPDMSQRRQNPTIKMDSSENSHAPSPLALGTDSAVSDFEVEIEAYPLRNQRGEIYHTIPAEKCRIGIVSRRRIGSGPDGKDVELPPETEAAFIRGNGAWLPPLFSFTDNRHLLPNTASEPRPLGENSKTP